MPRRPFRIPKPKMPRLPPIGERWRNIIPLHPRLPSPAVIELTEAGAVAGQVPVGFDGTFPEWLVFEWLTRRHIVFDFQTSLLGGRLEFGGAVADFVLPDYRYIWRVQGEYWHVTNAGKVASDLMQKARLTDEGYQVIDLYADDLLRHRDFVCQAALRGEETETRVQ